MIQSVDESVGRIREKIEQLGLDGNTAIFFTSDNGGLELRQITDNGVIRAGKGSAYEGGVRVPFIAMIPGVTLAGIESHVPVIGMDLYPTILNLAGLPVVEHDGKNLLPHLRSANEPVNRSTIFWHYPHYHQGGATPYSAMRKDNYKLIEFFEDGRLELYDLSRDIGEETDLTDSLPDLTNQLHQALQVWRGEVDAQYPSENPNLNEDSDN
jgi:arylsulfatase A-like enzyme